MAQGEHGGVTSGGTQGVSQCGQGTTGMFGATTMQGGRQGRSGGSTSRDQPDTKAPVGSPPSQSKDVAGIVHFIIGYFDFDSRHKG